MAKVIQPTFPKNDKRLLGVWKSDRRRTFADWRWKKNTPPRKRARLKAFFGKLEITYTRNKIHCRIPRSESENARRYIILGIDEESVAIAIFS
jgi:hypothetical protein